MKKLCASLLLISLTNSLITMEKKALTTSSEPINILKTSFEDGQQTGNSSPGRSRLANRVVNEDEKLQKEREQAIKQLQDEILAKKITDFIAHEPICVIKEIIQDKHKGRSLGDPEIDQELDRCLEKLKEKDINLEKTVVNHHPNEDPATFKIRSNPELCNEMDQQIISLALFLNKAIRFSNSK
jgi:hypothetical protein